jgi:hypothetical protein
MSQDNYHVPHDQYSKTATPLDEFIESVKKFNSSAKSDKSIAKLQKATQEIIEREHETNPNSRPYSAYISST